MEFCRRIIFFDKKNKMDRIYNYKGTTAPLKAIIYLDIDMETNEGVDKCGEAFLSKDLCGVLAIVDKFDDNDIGRLARQRVLKQGYTLVTASVGTTIQEGNNSSIVKECNIRFLYLTDEPSFVK